MADDSTKPTAPVSKPVTSAGTDNLKQPPPPTVVQKGPLLKPHDPNPQRVEKAEDCVKQIQKVDGATKQFSFRGVCRCGWQSYQATEAAAKEMVVRHAQQHIIRGDLMR